MTPESSTAEGAAGWVLRDYLSPGLRDPGPDAAFPHMRPGDLLHHPWKYLRRDVPHVWYADERYPLMGFLNRDEATLLHNLALQFEGKRALEIGSWLGWSTCHLALAGVVLDVIDPAHDDAVIRGSVESSLTACGVRDRVNLARGRSPESIAQLGRKWSLFFVDGDHEAPAPVRDALACLPYAEDDCAFVFHDLASPAVAAALSALAERGFHVVVYQTAQVMGFAWRGNVTPVAHVPDPDVAWQTPAHLAEFPVSGVDFVPPAPSSWLTLGAVVPHGEPSRPSVCIVTSEVLGPFKNGGIGTAMTGLAELLAGAGFRVTVLFTGAIWSPDLDLGRWRKRYAALGIELDAIAFRDMKSLSGPMRDRGFTVPCLVYRYLAARSFDVVHFNDCCGDGSLTLAAKKLGIAFQNTLLAVALHSPSRWVLELNETLPSQLLLAAFDYAERLSVRCADMLWSPSRYLLDWIASRGFELPRQAVVQQYVLPTQRLRERDGHDAAAPSPPAHGRHAAPKEIVFFGRLEERKGLRAFCNAIQLLDDELARRGVTVTFLGKAETCAGMPSSEYIALRSATWKCATRTITDLGQPEALQYLASGDKLAVMPSPHDNSPCTVYEALACGIPFLAARTGGIPELIASEGRGHVLFDHSTEGLRNAILRVLQDGGWIARPAVPFDETRRTWIAMHEQWRTFLPRPEEAGPIAAAPSLAVVIDHTRDVRAFDRTLHSVIRCPLVRRLIVINRGADVLPVASIDLVSADAGMLEVELAGISEDAVLLVASGADVVPDELERMARALASSPAQGLQPAARVVRKTHPTVIPPLGGSAAFGLFEGLTYTGALLVRRDALLSAKSGFRFAMESIFLGLADFCAARQLSIWPYPEVVIEHAARAQPVTGGAVPATVSAYADAPRNERYYMLAAGVGGVARGAAAGTMKRDLALAALDRGLAPVVRAASWALRRMRRMRS